MLKYLILLGAMVHIGLNKNNPFFGRLKSKVHSSTFCFQLSSLESAPDFHEFLFLQNPLISASTVSFAKVGKNHRKVQTTLYRFERLHEYPTH